MGLTLIFIGLLFTLNPMLALLDIIPDFIGYALIFIGVNKLGMISPEVLDSVNYFKWAAIISLARSLTFLASGGFDETMVLCLTMVFAVIEFGVMLFALPLLSDGLSYLNIRYSEKDHDTGSDGTGAEGGGRRSDRSKELNIVGLVFFAARGFLSVLPELGALSLGIDPDGDVTGEINAVNWGDFSTVLTLANIILTLAFAAFWAVVIVKYVGGMLKDQQFNSALADAYAEKKRTDSGMFIRRRLLYAFAALSLAAFALIDLTGDGINYLPDFLFGILSLVAVLLLSPFADEEKAEMETVSGERRPITKVQLAYLFGGIYTALSLASWIYSTVFFKNRYFMTFDTLMVMFPLEYVFAVLLGICEGVALVFYIRYLLPLLADVAKNHVGLIVTDEFVRTRKQNEDAEKTILIKLRAYFYAICAIAASGAIFLATIHPFPEYWMIHMALNIALYVFSLNITSNFISEVNMRYEKPGE